MAAAEVTGDRMDAAARAIRVARIALGLVAFACVETGLWALLAPRSFYNSFPGGGRHWVGIDGPFNEHLVRDVGALNLAVAVVLVAAVWLGQPALLRIAAVTALVWGVPHLLYHLAHLHPLATADRAGEVLSLGLGVVLPVIALV